LYVTGGVFMKYSAGLTRWLPELALVALFSARRADASLGAEQMTIKMISGVVLVVLGMILLRLS